MLKPSVYRVLAAAALLLLMLSIVLVPRVAAQRVIPDGYFREVRWLETTQIGVKDPTGLAYSAADETLLVLSGMRANTITKMGLYLENRAGEIRLDAPVASPLSVTYDSKLGSLLAADPASRSVKQFDPRPGKPWSSTRGLVLGSRQKGGVLGITVDPQTGQVYAVNADGLSISVIGPGGGEAQQMSIARAGMVLRGIAFNPADRHLFAMDPRARRLYEFGETGELLSTRELSELGLRDPQAMVFAPSGDNTDDPAALSLYIADSGVNLPGGGILEVSMIEPQLADFQLLATGSLVRTLDLSLWSPPAPDPSGIGYWPANGTLLVADSEVDEMPPYFTGKNIFQATISGTLVSTYSTMVYSQEPVGSAVNPANNHVFFSDDDRRRVFEFDLGPDGKLGTADDTRWYMSTTAVGSNDPEGIGYGDGKLFIADGTGSEVYVISPGPNNRFDGVPPAGDDQLITHFDTSAYGVSDPEGIDYHPDRGTVFIAGNNSRRNLLEMSPSGALVNVIDISFVPSMAPAGVAVAPSSINPAVRSIYISDRRVDNGQDPYENDGRVYEVSLSIGASTGTPTRTPTRTPTLTRTSTPTRTATPTSTASATATSTATTTRTPTQTNTPTQTRTHTPTLTQPQTATVINTPTHTLTPTVTSSPEDTQTPTQTPTPTVISSPEDTQTPTQTPTPTVTSAPEDTPTATPTSTDTPTPTPTTEETLPPSTATLPPTATLDPTVNLALNHPVTVSSIDPNNNGEGTNAVDGNLSTRWKSLINGTLPSEWIIVDLGQEEQISRVVLRWNYYAKAYTIDVSNDGQNWTTVFSTTTGNGDPDDILFNAVSARYVRMNSTAWYRPNQRIYLREIEVYH